MSLTTKVSDLATRIGTEFKTVYSKVGTLSSLTTTTKTDLVSAINEVKSTAGAQINDTTASGTTVYSSNKVNTLVNAKQDADADLSAIAGLAGTSGILTKTAANTWALDTNSYVNTTSYTASDVLTKIKTVDGAGSGLDADTLDGIDSTGFALAGHNHTGTYQPLDADLTAIGALAGTSGLLKKTAADTWTLDTTSYETAAHASSTFVAQTLLGANSGVATLDAGGKLVTTQLPNLAITDVYVVATQAAMLALTCQQGDVAIRTDLSKSFILSSSSPSTLADWKELLTPTDTVTSVDGRTGTVTLSDLYAPYSLVANVGDTTTDFVAVFNAALV